MDSDWSQLKLSLERPYKDDDGQPIRTLQDITQDGEPIYEPKEDPDNLLGENLKRIFQERGFDFFSKDHIHGENSKDATDTLKDAEKSESAMTPEELYNMRMQLMPHLYTALGEMSHARDLLAMLLATSGTSQTSLEATLRGQVPSQETTTNTTPSLLTAAVVTTPPPIVSVQAFNAQLAIGSKDEALRKAASILKSAAESVERGRLKGESYWVDALKIRRANWGLVPAPLPPGPARLRGSDLTSKDFLVSFGLEESAPFYRQQSIGYMANQDLDPDHLIFPFQQNTRLQVTIADINETRKEYHNTPLRESDSVHLESELQAAQLEMVEREIFAMLVKEAANLPTASARVSERLIVIDAAQGLELRFEMVEINAGTSITQSQTNDELSTHYCNLIYSTLHVLLLRTHNLAKAKRLEGQSASKPPIQIPASLSLLNSSSLLQPIVDILQYRGFCNRVQREVANAAHAVTCVGVDSIIRFTPLCEIGEELVGMAESSNQNLRVSGEAVLRIDQRRTLRFTFSSPSKLTAHLSQATLKIDSIPQLYQLLCDEVEVCLLDKISSMGSALCDQLGVAGTWFVDPVTCRTIGKWEGCALNFWVTFGDNYTIKCAAVRVERKGEVDESVVQTYEGDRDHDSRQGSLTEWAEQTIKTALEQKS